MPTGVYKRTIEHCENIRKSLNKPKIKEQNRRMLIKMHQDGIYDKHLEKLKEINKDNQYAKGHKQTEEHKNKIRIANSGKSSSSYKDGRTLKKHYCIECGKELSYYTHKRCRNCNMKLQWKNLEYKKKNKTNLGNKHTEETKRKLRDGIDRHHIYLNGDDSKVLLLAGSKHRQLHARAYDYLVKIGKIDNYIKWFDEKYGLFEKDKK